MSTNEQIIRHFCAAFCRMNADELIDYFTSDAVYHNIPLPALHGRAAIYQSLQGLPNRFKGLEIEILQQISAGDDLIGIVMNERIDYFQLENKRVALPIAGVFELENGKIKAWREYFDLAMLKNAG